MSYTTVFDVTQSGYRQWWFPVGLIFLAVGLAMFFLRPLIKSSMGRIFAIIVPVFAAFWTLSSLASTASDYFGLAADLRHGRCEVVESAVEQFDPMPYTGHQDESSVVAGHRFHYSDYEVSAGFNQSTSHRGPIHEGLQVRIHRIGNRIAKIEVAKSPQRPNQAMQPVSLPRARF